MASIPDTGPSETPMPGGPTDELAPMPGDVDVPIPGNLPQPDRD